MPIYLFQDLDLVFNLLIDVIDMTLSFDHKLMDLFRIVKEPIELKLHITKTVA